MLQYGVTGQTTADITGATPQEISKYKDQLMGMVVDPLSRYEVEELERQGKAKRAARKMKKEWAENAHCPETVAENTTVAPPAADVAQNNEEEEKENTMEELNRDAVEIVEETAETEQAANYPAKEVKVDTEPAKAEIVVDLVLGKGKGEVHLSAADVRTLGTIISMLEAVF